MNFKLLNVKTALAAVIGSTLIPALSAPAQAAQLFTCTTSCKLGDLVSQQGFFDVGDKRFSEFSFLQSNEGDVSPQNAGLINVAPLSGGADIGLVLQGGLFAGTNSTLDIAVKFLVTVLDPNKSIDKVNLDFNGFARGTGYASVAETVRDVNNKFIQNGFVDISNSSTTLSLLNPLKQIRVEKDIFLRGGSNGLANISLVTQQYHQVPVPSLVPGIIGLGLTMLRKRKSSATEQVGAEV